MCIPICHIYTYISIFKYRKHFFSLTWDRNIYHRGLISWWLNTLFPPPLFFIRQPMAAIIWENTNVFSTSKMGIRNEPAAFWSMRWRLDLQWNPVSSLQKVRTCGVDREKHQRSTNVFQFPKWAWDMSQEINSAGKQTQCLVGCECESGTRK